MALSTSILLSALAIASSYPYQVLMFAASSLNGGVEGEHGVSRVDGAGVKRSTRNTLKEDCSQVVSQVNSWFSFWGTEDGRCGFWEGVNDDLCMCVCMDVHANVCVCVIPMAWCASSSSSSSSSLTANSSFSSFFSPSRRTTSTPLDSSSALEPYSSILPWR